MHDVIESGQGRTRDELVDEARVGAAIWIVILAFALAVACLRAVELDERPEQIKRGGSADTPLDVE